MIISVRRTYKNLSPTDTVVFRETGTRAKPSRSRLSREGDHLLRFLAELAGQLNVLRHLPDGHTVVARLAREGPDTPRSTADRLEMSFEHVRHLCRALRQVGLVAESDGADEAGSHRPGTDSATDGTCYVVTERGNAVLDSLE